MQKIPGRSGRTNKPTGTHLNKISLEHNMPSVTLHILGFLACTMVIVWSGTKLARYGDAIAELTGLGKAWIGLILMASVTSLPELLNGISAVSILQEPDLAAGDIFGSCVFNLLILSFIDARIKMPLTSIVKSSHLFAGLWSILLLCTTAMAILLSAVTPNIGWINLFTFVNITVYMFAIWAIFRHEKQATPEVSAPTADTGLTLKNAVVFYILNALVVIVAAVFLPYFGNHIAESAGVSQTFFGTLFLAIATSLPELVVSFAAIRIGNFDMLVGNLLGSNIFNILILAIDDIFYATGNLYAHINNSHLISIIAIIIMTVITGIGLSIKRQKKNWLLSFDTFLILIIYILLMIFLFFHPELSV